MTPTARVALAVLLVAPAAAGQPRARVSFEQAVPVVTALSSNLPVPLRGRPVQDLRRLWPSWIGQHDRDVRARLARGDEDSVVNLWLYGTSFTRLPPAVAHPSTSAADVERLAAERLGDLLERLAAPSSDERLQFARQVLAGRGADPATAAGQDRARRLLAETRQRMMREFAEAERQLASERPAGAGALAAASATIFRDRGLSSDTSLLADFGVDAALQSIARQRTLAPGSVRRVAVVGPGLDFVNKADGYDFYPEQTIQPFSLVDSLRRHGLAAAELQVTTLDVSPRVNQHLRRAAARAATPGGYVVTLPLGGREAWTEPLRAYWRQWGAYVGEDVPAIAPPAAAGAVTARAVRLMPSVVGALVSRDVNIVVDRLAVPEGERFDLIVATNVLVYYDVFEQALAVANAASMLKPGGVLVTNTAVLPTPPMAQTASYLRVMHTPARYDELFWYVRD